MQAEEWKNEKKHIKNMRKRGNEKKIKQKKKKKKKKEDKGQ